MYRQAGQNAIENSSLFYQITLLLEQVPLYLFSQIIIFAQKPLSKIGASSLCVPQHGSSKRHEKALGLPLERADPAFLKFWFGRRVFPGPPRYFASPARRFAPWATRISWITTDTRIPTHSGILVFSSSGLVFMGTTVKISDTTISAMGT